MNSQPQAKRQQAKYETGNLNSVWFRPLTTPSQDENGNEEWVGKPEYCWPDVCLGT